MRQKTLARVVVATTIFFCSTTQVSLALTNEQISKVNSLMTQGLGLLKLNKVEEALGKFREAKAIYPNSPEILTNYALVLQRTGQYDEALASLNQAIKINSNFPATWINLASLYQSTGNIPKAIEVFEEYLKRFPKSPECSKVRSVLAILKDLKAHNAADKDSENSVDYFASISRNGIYKWQLSQFPLKVFIAKGSPSEGYKDSFHKAMESAFNDWQTKTDNVVSFAITDDQAAANIEVNWTNDEKKIRKKGEAGDCVFTLGTKGIDHAKIMILTVPVQDFVPIGDSYIYWVAMHEIGHSLGLEGHSINPKDTMYGSMTFDYENKTLSARDIATVQHLYKPEIEATGSPILLYNQAVMELKKQDKLPSGQRNYLTAIAQFEQLCLMFPSFQDGHASLAHSYALQAARLYKENKLNEAAGFFKKALSQYKKGAEDEVVTRQNYATVLKQLNRTADAAAVLAGKNP